MFKIHTQDMVILEPNCLRWNTKLNWVLPEKFQHQIAIMYRAWPPCLQLQCNLTLQKTVFLELTWKC